MADLRDLPPLEQDFFPWLYAWEAGDLTNVQTKVLFQHLIDEGHAWRLQGYYGRTAAQLIRAGYCHAKEEQ